MSVFRNVVFVAAIAGLIAGVLLACLQAFSTDPLILKAEVYEQAEGGHSHEAAPAAQSAAPAENGTAMSTAPAASDTAAAAEEEDEGWAPADGFERSAFNAVANVVTGIGFALILVAFSEFAGGIGNWRQGVFWGWPASPSSRWRPASACRPSCRPCPPPTSPSASSGGSRRWWQPPSGSP